MSRPLIGSICLVLLAFAAVRCATESPRAEKAAPSAETAAAPAPAAKKKILVVLSSSNKLTLKDGGVHPTGFYLNELVTPLQAIAKAGYQAVFSNPKGNEPVMDPASDASKNFGGDDARRLQAKAFLESLDGFKHPVSFHDLLRDGLDGYAGIFVPGGHAPMEDLAVDAELGRILRVFHDRKQPTALICHGPIALLSSIDDASEFTRSLGHRAHHRARRHGGVEPWPYAGYRLTVFSTSEERKAEDGLLGGRVRFYSDQALRAAGARIDDGAPFLSHVVVDRELVTGQNPESDVALSAAFLRLLEKQ